MDDDTREWLGTVEAAAVLGRAPVTLALWRRDGRGPAWRRNARGRVEYDPDSVRDWSKLTHIEPGELRRRVQPHPELLGLAEAAKHVGMSVTSFRRGAARGTGPKPEVVVNGVKNVLRYYSKEALDAWVEERRSAVPEEPRGKPLPDRNKHPPFYAVLSYALAQAYEQHQGGVAPALARAMPNAERAVMGLSGRDQWVLFARMQRCTLQQIADRLEISRERVRQLEERAVSGVLAQLTGSE